MANPDDHQVDLLIDQALASYTAEPDSALSQAVLRRIASSPSVSGKRSLYWRPAAIAGLAATLALWTWLGARQHPATSRQANTPRVTGVNAAPTPHAARRFSVQPAADHPHTNYRHRSSSSRSAALDPAPLTPEEKQLLLIVSQRPDDARTLISLHDGPPTPLQIEPLRISPIESSSINVAPMPQFPISQNHIE